jgi:hypothetical protein
MEQTRLLETPSFAAGCGIYQHFYILEIPSSKR